MAERRNYIALEWLTGEIEETLKQARTALEDFVADRDDLTKLRFCLTYAHQVHGSLKMLELAPPCWQPRSRILPRRW